MSDKFFEESTVAIGTLYTVVVLLIIASIMIWG